MMGRLERDQGQLFYSFCLEEVVPDDHQVRAIAAVLDLSWVYGELSPHYPAGDNRWLQKIHQPSRAVGMPISATKSALNGHFGQWAFDFDQYRFGPLRV